MVVALAINGIISKSHELKNPPLKSGFLVTVLLAILRKIAVSEQPYRPY